MVRHLAIAGATHHLLDPLIVVARHEPILRTARFDAVSGHRSYRAIVGEFQRPAVAIWLATQRIGSRRESKTKETSWGRLFVLNNLRLSQEVSFRKSRPT